MSTKCEPHHDFWTAALSAFLAVGLIISYLPQHLRIINKGTSQGLSPWALLLGSTSAASAMFNVIALQWETIKCCPHVGAGSCVESMGGVIQVVLQWLLFTLVLVLFIIYFPPHLKYVDVVAQPVAHSEHTEVHQHTKSAEWKLAFTLSWIIAIHFVFITFVTFLLLIPSTNIPLRVETWAGFLGLTAAAFAIIQYAPQIWETWNAGLVGALSIPMMCIQTPGATLMVLSIMVRPGTNWTSWASYAAAGIMQGTLLTICICWTFRQKRLGIDDFGRPLVPAAPVETPAPLVPNVETSGGETAPLLKRT